MSILEKAIPITDEQYIELTETGFMEVVGKTGLLPDNTYIIVWKHEDGTLYKTSQNLIQIHF